MNQRKRIKLLQSNLTTTINQALSEADCAIVAAGMDQEDGYRPDISKIKADAIALLKAISEWQSTVQKLYE